MKNYVVAVAGAVLLLSTADAFAQLGGMGGFGKKSDDSQSQSTSMSIGDWVKIAQEAEALVNKSAEAIAQAVLSKKDNDELDARKKAAEEIKDPAEKKAALAKIAADRNALIADTDTKAASEKLKKENDAKKIASLGVAVYNFVLGVLKDKELMETSKDVISSASKNPAALKDVGKVKDIAGSLSGQMAGMSKVVTKLPELASVAKVKLPEKASEPSKESKDI